MSRVTQIRTLIALVGGLFSALAFAKPVELDDISRKEVAERIAPLGSVCLEGEDCAANAGATASTASGPRSGEQIFNQFCTACHTSGLLGAPKKGDKAVWETKLAAAGDFSKLLGNAIKGVGSMPPKGTCGDCSDEEISNAIEFMSGLKP
ncbi:c-type cytochrome [Endozoicomonas sp. ALD040]|uniref:c-type cytochrome n=1 Tax=Endozoicomonas sp. ALD040 TaxID=3403079 RepID=UPI003BB1840C